ncbi:MAG: hypothetical protein ACRESQ_10185, partial [Gammaproteobacteria bacterium]
MSRLLPKILGLPLAVALLALVGVSSYAQPATPAFSMEQVLGYPYPSNLVSSPNGNVIAWVLDQRGVRNIWVAFGPNYQPKLVTHYENDDGQELSDLSISADGQYLV